MAAVEMSAFDASPMDVDHEPQWLRLRDEATGQIHTPRVAPHRLGLQPVTGSFKKPSKSRFRKAVWFGPSKVEVAGHSIITGEEMRPSQSAWRSQWTPEFHAEEGDDEQESSQPEKKRACDASFFWAPSPCDEPMTGISDAEDAEAMRYRQEELDLDRALELAQAAAKKNQSPGPVTTRSNRHLHPCLKSNRPQFAGRNHTKPQHHNHSAPSQRGSGDSSPRRPVRPRSQSNRPATPAPGPHRHHAPGGITKPTDRNMSVRKENPRRNVPRHNNNNNRNRQRRYRAFSPLDK